MASSQVSRAPNEVIADRYFTRRELIPGFPFQEFEGIPSHTEFWNDSNIRMVDGKLYRCANQKTLKFLNKAPLEIREAIFAQIITQLEPGRETDYPRMSPNLALNWVQNPAHQNGLNVKVGRRTYVRTYFSPVKYSFRTRGVTQNDIINDKVYGLGTAWKDFRDGSGMNFDGIKLYGDCLDRRLYEYNDHGHMLRFVDDGREYMATRTIHTWLGDREKEHLGLSKSVENDYKIVQSYNELLEFAKAIAHAEGALLIYNGTKSSEVSVWERSEKNSGVLRDFLNWFWREFTLDCTCEVKTCNEWLLANIQQFSLVQNLSIDVQINKYNVTSIPDFEKFCHHISQLSNIKSLTICLWIRKKDVLAVINNPGAHTWLAAIKSLPVSETFRIMYHMWDLAYDRKSEAILKGRKKDATYWKVFEQQKELDIWAKTKLRETLMPETLCQGKR